MMQMQPPNFYFFSGKGGVGKTTLAAAKAVGLARQGYRVLVASTDPAHSLSDVFDTSIGHEGARIEQNLYALEVDSSERWVESVSASAKGVQKNRKPSRLEQKLTDAMQMLGNAPGIDEFVSLELLLETMASNKYDQVVFDTAPTGHTLRLLLLPNMLDGWLGKMIALRGYFSKVSRAIRKIIPKNSNKAALDVEENLSTARDYIGSVRDLIKNDQKTSFSLVTIPEAMSVLETQRTLAQLEQHEIPVSRIVINQVQPISDDCRHCKSRRMIHQREIERIKEIAGSVSVLEVESQPIVVRGVDALYELSQVLK
jgi:arsenite-transporting ATPase